MKLLLTSGGITNNTLAEALEDLAGKAFDQLKIAFILTAAFCDSGNKGWLIDDLARLKAHGATIDIVDIAQLPTDEIGKRLEWSDVILVGGGNTFYLSYWMQKSKLFELLPKLLSTRVYAGISAGSMIASSTVKTASQAYSSEHFYDASYEEYGPVGRSSAKAMEWVDFAFRPHLNSRYFPEVTQEKMQNIADALGVEIYVVDDQCAVKVDSDDISVVGDGEWQKLEPQL